MVKLKKKFSRSYKTCIGICIYYTIIISRKHKVKILYEVTQNNNKIVKMCIYLQKLFPVVENKII